MDLGGIGTLLSAAAAVAMAALAWAKTRRSKPDLASQQVGYMARINNRLNAELRRRDERIVQLEAELDDERRRVTDLKGEVARLRARVASLEAA